MKKISTYLNLALFILATTFFMVSCKSDKSAEEEAATTQTQIVQPNKNAQPTAAQRNAQNNVQRTAQQRQLQQAQNRPQQRKKPKSYDPKVPGGKINWMTFEEAEKAMKKKPKKVFVDVYTEWCGWCKRLDQATFADKRVADYMNDNYYAIKFDAQHPEPIKLGGKKYANPRFDKSKPKRARNATHELAVKYKARSYPTVLFLDEKLDLIQAVPGYRDADAFLPILEQFKSL